MKIDNLKLQLQKLSEFLDFMPWYKTKVSGVLLGIVASYNLSIWTIDTQSLLTMIKTAFDQPEIIATTWGVIYWGAVKVTRKSYFDVYLEETLWKAIEFDGAYPNQCVDLVKHYTYYVHKISLWYFWWSALQWFYNSYNTFPNYDFNRIVNNTSDPSQVPNKEDIIFFWWTPFTSDGHVWIVIEAIPWKNKITILEQNWENNSWTWSWDDAVRIKDYTYKNVLWWYEIRK